VPRSVLPAAGDDPVILAHSIDGPQDAPVAVFTGSLGTTRDLWAPQVEALRDQLQMVRVDLRGHGQSPVPPGPYTVAELAQDAVDTMDFLGIERASWVGLSIGGMVGQFLAANAPERIGRLVVLFSAAAVPDPEAFRRRAQDVRERGGAGHLARELLPRWLTAAYRERHPEAVSWLSAMVAACPAEGYAGCAEALAAVDLRPELSRIAAKTLVVGGAQDLSLPPACAAHVAAGIRDAEYVELDPAAHLGNVERADTVNRLLVDFLV
jgi:3-oxoadipate enol-lactonase